MPLAQQGNIITTSAQFVAGVVDEAALATDAVTAAKIVTGAVDSAEILDGSIVNADISASAAIADSKLAQITTAGKVSGAALTSLANIPGGAGVIPAANVPAISLTYANGIATKNLADATGGTTVIAHGLGGTPTRVTLSYINCTADQYASSFGVFDDSGQNNIFQQHSGAASTVSQSAKAIRCYPKDANDRYQEGTVTVDGTNITITWAKSGTPTGTINILWAAEV